MSTLQYVPITLIGFGVAGQFLLSHILELVPAYKVAIVDPDFIGGDLARHYSAIRSNTMIKQKVGSLSKLPSVWSETIESLKKRGADDDTVSLAGLAADIRLTGNKLASKCACIYDKVSQASWNPDMKLWTLAFASGRPSQTTSIMCFCTGMSPRQEDYGIPSIPLSVALDPTALARTVNPGQHVTVVGSAHSATLILKHLNAIPNVSVSCLYKNKQFKFARDGNYDGIKKESADIADAILKGEYADLTMIKSIDIKNVSKVIRKCDWLIQATGFQAIFPELKMADGTAISAIWNPSTGLSEVVPQAQAFGACVPGVTELDGKQFPDISIGSFVDQLDIRWPLLNSLIRNLM
jgi:hypothetical protein